MIEIEVEADLVWPLVRGKDVHAFEVSDSGLVALVPHVPDHLENILTVQELIALAPRAFDYLEPHLDRLRSRSAYDMELTDERPWGLQGAAWRHLSLATLTNHQKSQSLLGFLRFWTCRELR